MFRQKLIQHIPTLAFFSGVCGLAYEILYARLLSSYIGNIFYVTAAILVSFLLSYGLGALASRRFTRFLPHIEIAIGVYGAIFGVVVTTSGFVLTTIAAGISSMYPALLILLCFVILAIPAFLIGFSIPLFTQYINHFNPHKTGFRKVYALYNLGAAAAVLLIEFVLIRHVGILASILGIVCINVTIGTLLFCLPAPTVRTHTHTSVTAGHVRIFWILFLAGVASGIFQILTIKTSHLIFGPFNENFAIILCSVLCGIALGNLLAEAKWFTLRTLLFCAAITTLVLTALIHPSILLYSTVYPIASEFGFATLLKVVGLVVFTLPIFTLFGATIPHVITRDVGEDTARYALAYTSLGNAIGYLLFAFILYERIPEPLIAGFVACILVTAAFLTSKNKGPLDWGIAGTAVACLLVVYTTWPSYLHDVGYRALFSRERLEQQRNSISTTTTYKKYTASATVSEQTDGTKIVSLDGYVSLRLAQSGESKLSETVVGLIPAFFSQRHEHALVFGLGTGITAGATAAIYASTTVAEINPAIPLLTTHFNNDNMGILKNKNANIVIEDGVLTLFRSGQRYDAIVNTVPSPTFFSANKLWTKDIFDAVSKKLNPGGVFVGWLDYYVGEEGFKIMHNTLHESFTDCIYLYLTPAYLGFVCGNEPLTFSRIDDAAQPIHIQKQLEFYEFKYPFSDILYDLLLDPALLTTRTTEGVNTLNFPRLEFIYSTGSADVQSYFVSYIRQGLLHEPFSGTQLTAEEVQARCTILSSYQNFLPEVLCPTY